MVQHLVSGSKDTWSALRSLDASETMAQSSHVARVSTGSGSSSAALSQRLSSALKELSLA